MLQLLLFCKGRADFKFKTPKLVVHFTMLSVCVLSPPEKI